MSDTVTNIQNATLGAGVTTGIMNAINANATAISVIATVGFGVIYASCAIWNAYSNHKRNRVNEEVIIYNIVKRLNDNGETKAADAVRRVSK